MPSESSACSPAGVPDTRAPVGTGAAALKPELDRPRLRVSSCVSSPLTRFRHCILLGYSSSRWYWLIACTTQVMYSSTVRV